MSGGVTMTKTASGKWACECGSTFNSWERAVKHADEDGCESTREGQRALIAAGLEPLVQEALDAAHSEGWAAGMRDGLNRAADVLLQERAKAEAYKRLPGDEVNEPTLSAAYTKSSFAARVAEELQREARRARP